MDQVSNPAAIKAIGKIAACRGEIESIISTIEATPLWQPGAALYKECQEILGLIDEQEKRFDEKLVIVVVGPGGSGKSTLVNALSGEDHLTDAGTQRPTTTNIMLACQSVSDANFITSQFNPDHIKIITQSGIFGTDQMLVVDTPDIDSSEQELHRPMVNGIIEKADMLLCIFNVENPKTRDHVDAFLPYIQRFNGESLICILNKCDRVDELELKEYILPDFKQYISEAWQRPMALFYCLSARRNLQEPNWDAHAEPKHDFDQFDELQLLLKEQYHHPDATIERRLKNVDQLTIFAKSEFDAALKLRKEHMQVAASLMQKTQKRAMKNAFETLKNEGTGQVLGVSVLLYQKIAQRWFGPVGWLIALWARILIFGTGIFSILRFGNPIRQAMGIFSSLRHFKDAEASIHEGKGASQLSSALGVYHRTILTHWPEIAESLVRAGFKESVRHPDTGIRSQTPLNEALSNTWQATLSRAIDRSAKRFSGLWLQILLNLPGIGMLGHIAWLTSKHYFARDYLSTDFFVHAFITAIIVMFLSFFIFQLFLKLWATPEKILGRAFEQMNQQIDPIQIKAIGPVFKELDLLIGHETVP